jgi:hypothetical protein
MVRTLLAVAALGLGVVACAGGTQEARPSPGVHDELSQQAGCSEVEDTGKQTQNHLDPGQRTTYDTTPPTGGDHAQTWLSAGVFDEPFSDDPDDQVNIYRAVHNLEHAYVLVWHNGLEDADRTQLEEDLSGERKVIVVPYPDLEPPAQVALTAWGRLQTCPSVNLEVVHSFIDLYRGADTAPEPNAP